MSAVEKIWKSVQNYGYKVRKSKLDGLVSWKKIKSILENYNMPIIWYKNALDRYQEMTKTKFQLKDEEKDSSWTENKQKQWELEHFFIQHSRIPHNNPDKPNSDFIRLMQIAYNAGQFKAEREQNSYPQEFLDYYDSNNMGTSVYYLNPGDIEDLDKNLCAQHPAVVAINDL